jgi:GT2 family glycosyltransferase
LPVKLSIIIATHARPVALQQLLRSLVPQLAPGRHQLIVAENGTPAPTSIDTELSPSPAKEPATVFTMMTHLHDPKPGKCRIQNRAIALATGDILAFLDDDVVAAPDYIDAVQRFFDDYPQFAAMKGRIQPANDPATVAGPMAPYLDLPIVDHGEEVTEVRGVLGANMAFRASALRLVGMFDERLGPGAAGHEEETELSQRLRRADLRIGYAPRALVLHEVDPARAIRARFIRVARERGYCRTLHEHHSQREVMVKIAIAAIRLVCARAFNASMVRIAREERRLAVAQGMCDGLAHRVKLEMNRSDYQ